MVPIVNFYFLFIGVSLLLSFSVSDVNSEQVVIKYEWRKEVLGSLGGEAMQLINAAEHKINERWVTCDPLAVAFYLKPHLVTSSTVWHASVELAGTRTRGQMLLDHLRKNRKQNVTIVETFNVEDFKGFALWCADRWTKAEP